MPDSDNRNSLLSYIVDEFTNQTELVATKALAYILGRSPAARDALRELLRIVGPDVGPIVSVEAESTGGDTGRVDLALRNDAGEERVLIEAKFWAGLTGNQPAAYLERLPNDGKPSVLLFVAPEMRLGTLWPLIRGRAEDAGFTLGVGGQTGEPGALRTAAVRGSKRQASERRLMLTGWPTLLGAMASRAEVAGDTQAGEDIRQLDSLCEQQDMDAFLPLRSEGLGPEFARLMPHLIWLVKDAISAGLASRFIVRTSQRFSSSEKEHGRRLILGGAYAWFGIDYAAWATVRETPLWLVLWDPSGWKIASQCMNWQRVRERLQPIFENRRFEILDQRNDEGRNHFAIPFDLPYGVERDAVLGSIVERLRELAKLISPPNGIRQGAPRKQKKG